MKYLVKGFKHGCNKLYHIIDPNLIDWAYFVVGSEWLTEVLGTISSKLADWGEE